MTKVGSYEETVIREEIECEVLRKKQQMLQTAINRQEEVDEDAIDAQLDQYRQQLLSEAAGPCAPQPYADLSEEQMDELQEIYRYIVEEFHPQVHLDQPEMHRQLFRRAQQAYRCRDLDALRLIRDMLCDTEEGITLELMAELMMTTVDEMDEIRKRDYATDYALAAEISKVFSRTEEEVEIRAEWERCFQLTEKVKEEMETLKQQFPYTTAEMLADPEKTESYKEELNRRLHTAIAEQTRRRKEIDTLIESVVVHE